MVYERILSNFEYIYNGLFPVWNWKNPVEKKTNKYTYQKMQAVCRKSQYFIAIFAILVAITFERSRQLFTSYLPRRGILTLLLDMTPYVLLGYFLGLKRLPANYISFMIIKMFSIVGERYKPELRNVKTNVLGQSRFSGIWSIVKATPASIPAVTVPSSSVSYGTNLAIVLVMLAGYCLLRRFAKVEIGKRKDIMLLSLTTATSLAALLLISSFAFDEIPEIKEKHRNACELWILFAVANLICSMAFLFDHIQPSINKNLKPKKFQTFRLEWEIFTFMLALYITIRYIPLIHDGFCTRDVLSNKWTVLGRSIVPSSLMNAWNSFAAKFYEIWRGVEGEHP